MATVKFCKDCKWYRKAWYDLARYAKCSHPDTQTSDYAATGELIFCITARHGKPPCGAEGKLWEVKEEPCIVIHTTKLQVRKENT